MMNDINNLFFELIQVAIGTRICLSHTPSADEWGELYAMAKKQSLVGVCFAGVHRLQEQQQASTSTSSAQAEMLYLRWLGMAAKIQQMSEEHRRVLKVVSEFLNKKGYRAVFMKGLTCAERYPDPLLRQCGDIDFVVREEDFNDVMRALEEIAEVDHDLVHEHHGMAHIGGVQLEPHYKIHNYQNPWNDRMMRSLQQELLNDKERCMMRIGQAEIEKFPLEFEGMFLVSHMVNHVYEEGLGLRQVMDFAMWLKEVRECATFDSVTYRGYLRKMHMERAAKIFTYICVKYLGTDRFTMGYAYTKKEEAFAEKLLADIMAVGNFARGAEERPEAGWQAYWWTTKRAWRLGYLCPSEAWWWPVSKFVRFFDKKLNSNKFKH